MSIIQINNNKVHMLEMNRGASQSIVMIHGMFTNLSVFYFNIAPELAKDYHIVMYDLRSHGMSERVDNGYSLDAMMEDLIALIDELGLEKVHLVGYSYGGLIALKTAMQYPDKIGKIAIIESPKPDQGEGPYMIQKYGNEFIDQYLNNYEATTNLTPSRRQIEKSKKLFKYLFNETTIKEDLELDNDLFRILAKNPVENDTLLLYGESSDCAEAGYFLEKHIPGAQLFIGNGDHNLPVQIPKWISDRLIEFIK